MNHPIRYNTVSRDELMARLEAETEPRIALAAYRYVPLDDVGGFRDELWDVMTAHNGLGRIYLSRDGINFQASVPESQAVALCDAIRELPGMEGLEIKHGLPDCDRAKAFWKLQIKIRPKLVADGKPEWRHDPELAGEHLDPDDFDALLDDPDAIVIDMRNDYESRIGHFEGAYLPPQRTFSEVMRHVEEFLKEHKAAKIGMYCTGGIRCEPASAYFRSLGYENVYQLDGGIIKYANLKREAGEESRYKGKNYVFDERTAEVVTEDIVGTCECCGKPYDDYIQCEAVFDDIRRLICPECMQLPQYQELAQRLHALGAR